MTQCKHERFLFRCDRMVRIGDYCWQHRPPTEEERHAAREKRKADHAAQEAKMARWELERDAGVLEGQIKDLDDAALRKLIELGGLRKILLPT